MATLMSFFNKKQEIDQDNIDSDNISNEINKLKGTILEINSTVQKNISEKLIEQINDKELSNDESYDCFSDFIYTFENLKIIEIIEGEVEFTFFIFTEEYKAKLPINIFYNLMITKKLLDLSEKEEVEENTDNVSKLVNNIY